MKESLRTAKWKDEAQRSGLAETDLSGSGKMMFSTEQAYSIISKTRQSAKENGA
jgi:hypothetical protein